MKFLHLTKKSRLALIALLVSCTCFGQDAKISNKMGIGFQLNQYQKDFGLGLSFTSPFMIKESLAVRARVNMMFNEHVKNAEVTWTPYSNVTFGVLSTSGIIADFMRMYGEGGVIGIVPSSEFSSEEFEFGGYGLFGFEFFMSNHFNYFIEIGGMGTGAQADKVTTSPIYSNGLTISTGFRVYL